MPSTLDYLAGIIANEARGAEARFAVAAVIANRYARTGNCGLLIGKCLSRILKRIFFQLTLIRRFS